MKFEFWTGQDLSGLWEFSRKIDGVRLHHTAGRSFSRAEKPLYNIPELPDGIYEVFLGDWERTISAVRTHNGAPVDVEHFYRLDVLDPRLFIGVFSDPTAATIALQLDLALADGFEGLVLQQYDRRVKVKPEETYDVPITAIQPGTGKHTGRMGALITPKGKVGTGFTDKQREELNDPKYLWSIIEVECMRLTPQGKFRHPRFVRLREDKCSA